MVIDRDRYRDADEGRSTIRHLVQRTDAARVLALSRTPEGVADLGVRARPADFDEPDALVRALDGVERLLIISIGTDDRLQSAAAPALTGHERPSAHRRTGRRGAVAVAKFTQSARRTE